MGIFRLILAVIIMIGHYRLMFPGSYLDDWFPYIRVGLTHGAVKVNSFFIISGFYTQMLLETKFAQRRPADFYLYRAIRLLPMYYLCFCLLVLVSLFANIYGLSAKYLISAASMSSPIFWLQNLTIFIPSIFSIMHLQWFEVPYALALRQAWTLADEIAIIAMVPFLLRNEKRFWVTFAIAAIFAVHFLTLDRVRDYLGATMIYFMLGAAGYKFYQKELVPLACTAAKVKLAYAMVALLAVLLVYYRLLNDFLGMYPMYFIFMGLVVVFVPWIAAFTRHLSWDRHIGSLSYPIYLSHFLFYSLLQMMGMLNGFIFALIGVILFSLLVIRTIEKPLVAYRRQKIA